MALNRDLGLSNSTSNAPRDISLSGLDSQVSMRQNSPLSNHGAGALVVGAKDISNVTGNRYTPLWTKLDSSSDYHKALKINKNVGRFEFGIDVYVNGGSARSFDVTCMFMISEVDQTSSCPYPHPGDALILRQPSGAHWLTSDSTGANSASLSLGLVDLLKGLVIEAAHIPLTSPERPQLIDGPSMRAAVEQLENIYKRWEEDLETPESLSESLDNILQRYPNAAAIKEFFDKSRIDPDFTSALFLAVSNISSRLLRIDLRNLLIDYTTSPKSSVRYAAIEALSYHIDSDVKQILNIRLKTEKNRTVAALIAASID